MKARLARLPIRLRLVAGFAFVMAIVLTVVGAFVYERTSSDLDRQIQRELSARLAGVIAILRDDGDDLGDPEQDPLDRVDPEGTVQVLSGGRVVDATPAALRVRPLLSPPQIRALLDAGDSATLDVPGPDGPLRVVAGHTQDDGVRYVPIVGASLDARDQTLSDLARLLSIGGPVALVLASLAAFWVASSALRPVEAIRRRAAEIGEHEPGGRLPVPPAGDELSLLAETLNEMLARLERALARERRFVADASHELRTPLTILKAEIELALASGRSPAELRAALLSGGEEVDRLSRLADDLLVLARSDEGRLPLRPEEVEIAALARAVAERFRSASGERRIEINIPGELRIAADPQRLEQALSNLIDNAIRHGGGTISVFATHGDEEIAIHVRDEGTGIPAELRGQELLRFARADAARGSGGAGLGLAIVAAVADAHGGRVLVEEGSGGADLAIVLPHAPSRAAERASQTP